MKKPRDVTRRIWLCADDYGMAPGVSRGIRELVANGRLNATSAMVISPHLTADEVAALVRLNANEKRVSIGLHFTLTGPFKPLTAGYAPKRDGAFLPLGETMRNAVARRLRPDMLTVEIAAQLEAFRKMFGAPPDFVDGHQHVQLFPQVRDAFLRIVAEMAPNAWVRQCGRANSLRRLHDRKALVLDILSMAFRRRAERQGLATNTAFAGAYDFSPKAKFARIFPRFLTGLPDGGLIMCHPGFVDHELKTLDPLTTLREHEFAYFNSDAFPRALAEHGAALA